MALLKAARAAGALHGAGPRSRAAPQRWRRDRVSGRTQRDDAGLVDADPARVTGEFTAEGAGEAACALGTCALGTCALLALLPTEASLWVGVALLGSGLDAAVSGEERGLRQGRELGRGKRRDWSPAGAQCAGAASRGSRSPLVKRRCLDLVDLGRRPPPPRRADQSLVGAPP